MADLKVKTIEQLLSKQLMKLPLSRNIRKNIFVIKQGGGLR